MSTSSRIQSSHTSLMAKLRAKVLLLLTFTTFLFSSLQARYVRVSMTYPQNNMRRMTEPLYQNKSSNKDKKDDNKWFIYHQTLDHYNYNLQSYSKFPQRYVINSRYWGGAKNTYPIIVVAGDNWSLEKLVYSDYIFSNLASRFKALILYIEHRYYGHSMPFGSRVEAFRNTSTRGYLSSAQAMADYAEVILHVKYNHKADKCPVIILGASYGGMLAAWFRLKYPHIVIGALASSAPILYFDDITPQNASLLVISKAFREASRTCYNTIKESWADIEDAASYNGGLEKLRKTFNSCRLIHDTQDLKDYLVSIYKDIGKSEALINYMCVKIDNTKGNTLSKVKAGISQFESTNCTPGYDTDGWDFQLCTEMVWPIGGAKNSMFPSQVFDIKQYTNKCRKKWNVTPRPSWATTQFGGHNISIVLKNFASNIIFSNGLKDPDSVAGVLKSISKTVVALVTKEGESYLDFHKPLSDDPEWLVKQRNEEIKIIGEWLSEYNANLDKSM